MSTPYNNFNDNIPSNAIDYQGVNPKTGSVEKILNLPKGDKIWYRTLAIFLISLILFVLFLTLGLTLNKPGLILGIIPSVIGIIYCFIFVTCCNGFVIVNPNEAIVFEYYGRYLGTIKENGYFYGYPLAKRHTVNLRSNQYNGNRLKVNERDGNPVELGIIVVWRIGDTAKAVFDVVGYQAFIHTQSEAAIRFIGCKYPYEPTVKGEISLRGGQEIINKELKQELEKRVKVSGIIIEDARVTEISYGAGVARMMLQKQASNATVFAKDAIVKGAAGAVIHSLNEFESQGIQFTNEEKAKYVTGMMTTLCMSSDISKSISN